MNFISHVHKDDHGPRSSRIYLFRRGWKSGDSSIHTGKFNNATDEHYIKTQILAPAINWAGVFICYVPPNQEQRLVNWEIEYAGQTGQAHCWGLGAWREGWFPDALKEHADALVGEW